MNNNISSFNREIRSIIKNTSSNATFAFVDEYCTSNRHSDYYTALVNLSGEIGFDFCNEPIENEKGGIQYLPFLKFRPQNIFDIKPGIESLSSISNAFTDINKAYRAMAKAYLYRLSDLGVERHYPNKP